MTQIDIDALYDVFCSRLPAPQQQLARDLPRTLGLSPSPGVPWSGIFRHAVTLSAPALIAEGKDVSREVVEGACLAHMLAVIEAFGTDRIADGQAPSTTPLLDVLSSIRRARDEALEQVGGAALLAEADAADRRTRDSIARERDLLLRGERLAYEVYEEIARGKQAVGLVASVALGMAAGWQETVLSDVRSTLLGAALGLQYQDDVADWEEDVQHGGAWAVVLGCASATHESPGDPNARRGRVLSSGVLFELLDRSRQHYETAAAGAEVLGAGTLARWASAQAEDVARQAEGERRSAGYVSRYRQLQAWKAEMLR